jgi:hypothetical protein
MTLTCAKCNEPCDVKKINSSFAHEFGTEPVYYFGSTCCNSDEVINEFGDWLTQNELEELWELER